MTAKVYITIVDDHELFRDGLKLVLSNINTAFIISEACNGMEFLKSLESQVPDVVLMDISMPVLNGRDTVVTPDLPFWRQLIIMILM